MKGPGQVEPEGSGYPPMNRGKMQRRAVIRTLAAVAGAASSNHLFAQAWRDAGEDPAARRDPSMAASPQQRMALLLPKSSGPLNRAASAVRAGLEEAFKREGSGFLVDIYELDDTPRQMVAAYRGMAERGTSLVLGPLTRDGTAALLKMGDVPITTLALNQFEAGASPPSNVLSFNLGVEAEARQMADEAMRQLRKGRDAGSLRAAIVSARSLSARRGAAAFGEAWGELGGEPLPVMELDQAGLYKFRASIKDVSADLHFLSMGVDLARNVRLILGRGTPVFGTSMLSTGGAERSPSRVAELEGVRVLEMPALLVPNYVSARGYAAPPASFSLEMQRLYALGVDAFRMARTLFEGATSFDFNGLTGNVRYASGEAQVARRAAVAEYHDGVPMPV